jgi:hypothetical protein
MFLLEKFPKENKVSKEKKVLWISFEKKLCFASMG